VALETVRDLLRGLDRGQRSAVTHRDGPLLVVAGPGTGKKEVITRRIAWLIATKRALPSQILALTFTERATEEMQERVDELVPYGQADCAIHTFHALGDGIVREYGFELGLPDALTVIRAEAAVLLSDHLFDPLAQTARGPDAVLRPGNSPGQEEYLARSWPSRARAEGRGDAVAQTLPPDAQESSGVAR
jgi:superfamily I DNA/RNA helicase